ncbi:hypothetical protein Lalb_Chr04g0255071 [Lupinus albus]|uniref:Uncharacterized protein n=1 Tax=Lupinus albus TaxID=3870 RepID=A0A6A4QR46_LUPAL|nr:hypothetical protein Lalb_Chr04g0255071 [Lupinus albus]
MPKVAVHIALKIKGKVMSISNEFCVSDLVLMNIFVEPIIPFGTKENIHHF